MANAERLHQWLDIRMLHNGWTKDDNCSQSTILLLRFGISIQEVEVRRAKVRECVLTPLESS